MRRNSFERLHAIQPTSYNKTSSHFSAQGTLFDYIWVIRLAIPDEDPLNPNFFYPKVLFKFRSFVGTHCIFFTAGPALARAGALLWAEGRG